MPSERELASKRKPPIAVSFSLIALGATAVVVPIILLCRTRGAASSSVRELHSAPPPIRRVPGLISHSSFSSAAEACTPPWHRVKSQPEIAHAVDLQKQQNVGIHSVSNRTSGAFYALKALGIATCIVGASAVTSVFVVGWVMGVQSTEEFAARVRPKMQSLTQMLSSRIYKHHSDSSVETEEGETEERIWADLNERLSKAYEEGGLTQWMSIAEKELELEVNNERKRRAQCDERPIGT